MRQYILECFYLIYNKERKSFLNLLNYAIDLFIKLCYYITIKGKQKTSSRSGRAKPGESEGNMKEYNVYECMGEKKWFMTCLGNDEFTAEVLISHMEADWANGHHLSNIIMICEEA